MTNVVGIMGFKGSGKDTAAEALYELSQVWHKVAYADALKNTLCCMFGWHRDMMEGKTAESRVWRERVDPWWSEKLGIPHFTPRFAMTHIGTDIIRQHFNDNMWILAAEREVDRILGGGYSVVITDCRYPNEAEMIRKKGGKLLYVTRGTEPEYYQYSSIPVDAPEYAQAHAIMKTKYSHVHSSEWAWNNIQFDAVIDNNGSIKDLFNNVYGALGLREEANKLYAG